MQLDCEEELYTAIIRSRIQLIIVSGMLGSPDLQLTKEEIELYKLVELDLEQSENN